MADDGDRLSAVLGEPADDRMIVGEAPVAVELVPAGEQPLDVVERVRPVRVPRHEHALPRRQSGVDLRADFLGALSKCVDRFLALGRARHQAERLDLLQEDADRFLEFEQVGHMCVSELLKVDR